MQCKQSNDMSKVMREKQLVQSLCHSEQSTDMHNVVTETSGTESRSQWKLSTDKMNNVARETIGTECTPCTAQGKVQDSKAASVTQWKQSTDMSKVVRCYK